MVACRGLVPTFFHARIATSFNSVLLLRTERTLPFSFRKCRKHSKGEACTAFTASTAFACPPLFGDGGNGDDYLDDIDWDSLGSLKKQQNFEEDIFTDLSGCESRRFSLGYDLVLSSFAGSMGFDEVVDWEYFDNPGEERRNIVEPSPLDPTKPKRTKKSSGGVVRIFLGELSGAAGSSLRSRGLDCRVLVKEFSGDMTRDLADAELAAVAKLQTELVSEKADTEGKSGDWWRSGASRFLDGKVNGNTRRDDSNLIKFLDLARKERVQHVVILGKLDLSDLESDEAVPDRNEWYRALGTTPPKPGSVWIVYEYAGLQSAQAYAEPHSFRRAKMPLQKNIFGMAMSPPELPPWRNRADYVVGGILKGALEALAELHERGIAHRSISRSTIILSSVGQDKTEASSPFAVSPSSLVVKLSDFGFSGLIEESAKDESFRSRARGFGIDIKEGTTSALCTDYAMAEDIHALGFVFVGVLLTALAEPSDLNYNMPPIDEDRLQRLLSEIFKKDMNEFREYCDEEDELWGNVVVLLDENDGAGWELLRSMCFAREIVSEKRDGIPFSTARALLSNPLFSGRK